FNRITHSCPHRKNTSMFYFGSQRSVFKLEGVFYLSHLMGSVPSPFWGSFFEVNKSKEIGKYAYFGGFLNITP
ncbi:hypothetical protein ACQCVC_20130, partial [Bacillus altitudinis]|uniref:hypothetical protein n=1 Tax=Bacillus altitudinis TaxID=293387 RepID=UPI003CF7E33C